MALRLPPSYYDKLAADYLIRRDRMLGILEAAGFTCFKPRGAYYIMTDISSFSYPDDVSFAKFLVEKVGVAVVPGSRFYNDARDGASQVRFSFCKTEKTVYAAAEKLLKLRQA